MADSRRWTHQKPDWTHHWFDCPPAKSGAHYLAPHRQWGPPKCRLVHCCLFTAEPFAWEGERCFLNALTHKHTCIFKYSVDGWKKKFLCKFCLVKLLWIHECNECQNQISILRWKVNKSIGVVNEMVISSLKYSTKWIHPAFLIKYYFKLLLNISCLYFVLLYLFWQCNNYIQSIGFLGTDGKIFIWNVSQGEILIEIDCTDPKTGNELIPLSVSFNYNGSKFAATFKDKKIRIYNARSGECLKVSNVIIVLL